jgi:hypothetical protein
VGLPPIGHKERHLLKLVGLPELLVQALVLEGLAKGTSWREGLSGLVRQHAVGQFDQQPTRLDPHPLIFMIRQQALPSSQAGGAFAPDLNRWRRPPGEPDIAFAASLVAWVVELSAVEQHVLVDPGRTVVMPHRIREVVLKYQDRAIGGGAPDADEAAAVVLHVYRQPIVPVNWRVRHGVSDRNPRTCPPIPMRWGDSDGYRPMSLEEATCLTESALWALLLPMDVSLKLACDLRCLTEVGPCCSSADLDQARRQPLASDVARGLPADSCGIAALASAF